jgi:iron complex outermembrane recepter protein
MKITPNLSVKGRIGLTKGTGITESQPSLFYGVIDPPGASYRINVTRPSDWQMLDAQGRPLDLSRTSSYSLLHARPAAVGAFDEQGYGNVDVEWKQNEGVVRAWKFGGRAGKHERNYEIFNARWNVEDQPGFPGFTTVTAATLASFIPASAVPVPATAYPSNYASGLDAVFPRNLFRFDQAQLSAFARANLNWDRTANRLWTNSYTVEETTAAAYVMADLDFGDVTGNAGLRFVRTDVRSVAYQALPATTCAVLAPCPVPGAIVGSRNHTALAQTVETSHDVLLPSLNLRYRLAGGHILRGSLSKTMGRPNYGELAGAVTLDNVRLTGSSGNPTLKPITATNMDLSWAWYFKPQAYVMAAAFAQDLKDYVKAGTSQVEFFNTNTNTTSLYTLTSRYGVKARIRGVELAMDMPLTRGFGVGANLTYVDGRDQDGVELLGTSRTTANVIGWYEDDKFSARMAWNQRSDYAIGFIGNGTNTPNNGVHRFKGSGSLSLSLGYKVTKNLSVTFDGNNLNDPVRSTYYLTENAPGYWHQSGRQYFLNLRYKM